MAIVHTDQRKPFALPTSRDDDPLPAHLYRSLARNANNLITFVTRPPLILQHWAGGEAGPASGTTETFVAEWARRTIARWYRTVRFVVGAIQTVGTGAGTQNVTLTFKAYQGLYRGSADHLPLATSTVLVNNNQGAGGHAFYTNTLDISSRTMDDLYFVLTATNNHATLASATLYTLKAWAEVAAEG